MPDLMNVLCLKDASAEMFSYAEELAMQLQFCPVIKPVSVLNHDEVMLQYKDDADILITSANAARIVEELLKELKPKRIFCVGELSAKLLAGYCEEIVHADNSEALIQKILVNNVTALIHFCSNIALGTIKEAAHSNNIEYKELISYETVALEPKIDNLNSFDALLFFSPSGVRSFMVNNDLPETIIGAIGSTTANCIDNTEITVASKSNSNELLKSIRQRYDRIAQV